MWPCSSRAGSRPMPPWGICAHGLAPRIWRRFTTPLRGAAKGSAAPELITFFRFRRSPLSHPSMSSIFVIAIKELRDRLRSGWIIACALVWLGAISLTSLFGLIQIGHIGAQGFERTTMSLLNLAQYLVPLLGLLVGHDLVAREREDRTLNLILASGVTRSRVLLGKFLGGALTVSVPLFLGFGIAGALIGAAARDRGFEPFLKLGLS